MSRIANVFENFTKNENRELAPAVKKTDKDNRLALSRKVTSKDVTDAMKKKASTFNGNQYISSSDATVLGSYEGGSSIENSSDDILSRLIVEKSTHLSNWKDDSLVGNGEEKVSCTINIIPTWDSKRKYMHISRLIVWVVPTIPDSQGFVKATIIDQNKLTPKERLIIGKQGTLANPLCFVFHLNWSFNKDRNVPKRCMQLNLTSNEKYAKGVSFASVMYSWVKNFCDTAIASDSNTCDVIPINRAKAIKSAALIEACKLMIPKGTTGKAIKNQIVSLQKIAEKVALEDDADEVTEVLEIEIDDPNDQF
ncbi:putative movement protein [Orthotospovirus polygonianuli]|uniref:NSm n=2 Tax=Orthotospovirus polygonianuli TaxID=3052582 RepID=A0A1C9I806_9VIRU|nr:putative movement protein [Orthotospovirus polygonianuli]AHZ45963.1 putative movement protein [Orthotospovirus polygonianuli]AOO95320.1 NSm [Polygonum ringspot virus]